MVSGLVCRYVERFRAQGNSRREAAFTIGGLIAREYR